MRACLPALLCVTGLLLLPGVARGDEAVAVEQDGVRERASDVDAENRHLTTLRDTTGPKEHVEPLHKCALSAY